MKLHPMVAGVINAVLPGLGYVLLKERVVFGWLMLVGTILYGIVLFTDPSSVFDTLLLATSPLGKVMEALSYILITLAFAYDAYSIAAGRHTITVALPPLPTVPRA
ncbi:MAG: hypothetical protein V4480_00805 [Patescibacteria group bacterium]